MTNGVMIGVVNNQVLIAPSILAADLGRLREEVASIEPYADWLQVDVMDGHFVPNLSFGAPVINWIETKLTLDIHLMVANPEDRIEEFLKAGADHITFHAEAADDPETQEALVAAIRDGGATAGIALKPETPLAAIAVLDNIDLLLIMSVDPGFGGQAFIPAVLEKVKQARAQYPDLMIQIDGGIDDKTAPQCIAAGANNLVAGSFIFRAANRAASIAALRGS